MFEIKVTIEAPAIVEAIKGLTGACSSRCAAPVSFAAPPMRPGVASGVAPQPMHPEVTSGVAPQQKQLEAPPVMNPPVSPEPEKRETVAAPVQQATATQSVAPQVTLDDLSRAGASLVDKGKMPQVIKLLEQYGVQAITQLSPAQYQAIAEDFKALGAVM